MWPDKLNNEMFYSSKVSNVIILFPSWNLNILLILNSLKLPLWIINWNIFREIKIEIVMIKKNIWLHKEEYMITHHSYKSMKSMDNL